MPGSQSRPAVKDICQRETQCPAVHVYWAPDCSKSRHFYTFSYLLLEETVFGKPSFHSTSPIRYSFLPLSSKHADCNELCPFEVTDFLPFLIHYFLQQLCNLP